MNDQTYFIEPTIDLVRYILWKSTVIMMMLLYVSLSFSLDKSPHSPCLIKATNTYISDKIGYFDKTKNHSYSIHGKSNV